MGAHDVMYERHRVDYYTQKPLGKGALQSYGPDHGYYTFHGLIPGEPYFGAECEMEFVAGKSAEREKNAKEVLDFVDNCPYHWGYKGDGSLRDGVEFVSHPFQLAYMRYMKLPALFRLFDAYCGNHPADSAHNTAGLHIHMSRSAFTDVAHQQRFIMFHYWHAAWCKKFARRDSSYGRFWDSEELAARHLESGFRASRYAAVNVQNRATLELRYFSGTTDVELFKAYVEWAHAIWAYTKDPDNDVDVSDEVFLGFLAASPRYSHAFDHAKEALNALRFPPKG